MDRKEVRSEKIIGDQSHRVKQVIILFGNKLQGRYWWQKQVIQKSEKLLF